MTRMNQIVCLLVCLLATSGNAASVGVLDPLGNVSPNASAAAIAAGSTTTDITSVSVVAQSSASLFASYDALLFNYDTDNNFSSTFWNDTLLGYIQLGGGVIYSGSGSATNALVGSGLTTSGSLPGSSLQVVTDNLFAGVASLTNHYTVGSLSGDSNWTAFLESGGITTGMYATFGLGRIIVHSSDFFFHNQTPTFLANEITYVTSPESAETVPLPTASLAGVIGFGLISMMRRKRLG